jgi:hypothetical protein
MTTKTLKDLTDELRMAQEYEGEAVGDPGATTTTSRVVALRDEINNHPEAIALAERFAKELKARQDRCRAFYADPTNKGRYCISVRSIGRPDSARAI